MNSDVTVIFYYAYTNKLVIDLKCYTLVYINHSFAPSDHEVKCVNGVLFVNFYTTKHFFPIILYIKYSYYFISTYILYLYQFKLHLIIVCLKVGYRNYTNKFILSVFKTGFTSGFTKMSHRF